MSWLQSFSWLSYSASEDGAYCLFCIAFGCSTTGKGNHQILNTFVKSPFRLWKKAIEKFKEHQDKEYHKTSVERGANFKLIHENQKNSIICEIDTGRKKQQLENRKKIIPIIRTVLLCGRQGLSLRGHRDHGSLSLDLPIENDGNFRALLRFAIDSGDISLKNHIENTGRNSLYISPQIQNEIAHIAGGVIQRKIIERINKSHCFSIIADETTDVSGIEQFSICIRYVDKVEKEHSLREDFLCFVPVEDTTGAGLANTLVNELKNLKLNLENIRGQGKSLLLYFSFLVFSL